MARATWNGAVLAESESYEVVENNVYFPPDSIDRRFLRESEHKSVCPWKGTASYYDIVVEGNTNRNAAWYYPEPSDAAKNIKDHVAFWKGVKVES